MIFGVLAWLAVPKGWNGLIPARPRLQPAHERRNTQGHDLGSVTRRGLVIGVGQSLQLAQITGAHAQLTLPADADIFGAKWGAPANAKALDTFLTKTLTKVGGNVLQVGTIVIDAKGVLDLLNSLALSSNSRGKAENAYASAIPTKHKNVSSQVRQHLRSIKNDITYLKGLKNMAGFLQKLVTRLARWMSMLESDVREYQKLVNDIQITTQDLNIATNKLEGDAFLGLFPCMGSIPLALANQVFQPAVGALCAETGLAEIGAWGQLGGMSSLSKKLQKYQDRLAAEKTILESQATDLASLQENQVADMLDEKEALDLSARLQQNPIFDDLEAQIGKLQNEFPA